MAAKVFFSYSHADETLRNQLEIQLIMLKRQGLIETWHDRRINAGDDVDFRIDEKLNEADIILLLLSPDFLASKYCYDIEKDRALERHKAGTARLISVVLRPCEWQHTELRRFLVTPTDGRPITRWPDRDEAFLDVAKSVRATIEGMGKATTSPQTDSVVGKESAAETIVNERPLPRSSNLRVAKQFSQADLDRFTDDTFDYIAKFFEGSLLEIQTRNQEISVRFKRIDATRFTSAIYRGGSKVEACTIFMGGSFGSNSIHFVHKETSESNSYNESLSAAADTQSPYLRAMGMSFQGAERDNKLTMEGAAEFFWELFIANLQR